MKPKHKLHFLLVGDSLDCTDLYKTYVSFRVAVHQFSLRTGKRFTLTKRTGRFVVRRTE